MRARTAYLFFIIVACLIILAGLGYVLHMRWPLSSLAFQFIGGVGGYLLLVNWANLPFTPTQFTCLLIACQYILPILVLTFVYAKIGSRIRARAQLRNSQVCPAPVSNFSNLLN